MATIHKLVVNGNSVQVSLPKMLREHLGWRAGQRVTVELGKDETIVIRRARESDLDEPAPLRSQQLALSEVSR